VQPSRSSSLTLAAVLAAGLFTLAPAGPAAALPQKPPVTVNGERISAADVELVVRDAGAGAGAGLSPQQALEGLIAETVVLQEARRLKIEGTPRFSRALRRWRENRAIGLIGVDELRRVAGHGKPVPFAAFYPQGAAAFAALSEAEFTTVDNAVKERISKLHTQARVLIDGRAVRQYAVLRNIQPETVRSVVAATTSWGTITLEDIVAEEPQNLGHQAQNTDDVLKMWQQIASELAGRMCVLATAEKAGFFAVPAVKADDARARRQLVQTAYFESYFAERVTPDALTGRIGQSIDDWTRDFGLSVEVATLPHASRLDAETALTGWRDGGGALPPLATREKLTLGAAWPRFSADQKRIVMDQPWSGVVPPLRSGDGYQLLRLEATAPPKGSATLRDHAEALLREELRAAKVRELLSVADIKEN